MPESEVLTSVGGGERNSISTHGFASASSPTVGNSYGATYASDNARVQLGDQYNHYHVYQDPSIHARYQALASLAYAQMYSRYEQVHEANEDTYEWIIHGSKLPHYDLQHFRQEDNSKKFNSWLKQGITKFWIQGKPGSGKSTLMKYLVRHFTMVNEIDPRDPDAGPEDSTLPIVLHHFFWISGQTLQKNISGCIRSLLVQLLQDHRSTSVVMRHIGTNHHLAWPEQRLRQVLSGTVQDLDYPVIFLLDGLDECDDQDACVDFIQILLRRKQDRLCISSRPEQGFLEEFDSVPGFRMQDVNQADIETVIQNDLLNSRKVLRMIEKDQSDNAERHMQNIQEILERNAQGVFLWVHLVIRNLLQGISNRDSLQMLTQRVEQLPNDLYELLRSMLELRRDNVSFYREQASLYLRLVLHQSFNLEQFYFAIDKKARDRYLLWNCGEPDIKMYEIELAELRAWVEGRTAGLVEVVQRRGSLNPKDLRNYSVQFFHRSVRDFLIDTDDGQRIIGCDPTLETELHEACLLSRLVSACFQPRPVALEFGNIQLESIFMCKKCPEDVFMSHVPMIERFLQMCLDSGRILLSREWTACYTEEWLTDIPVVFQSSRGGIDLVSYALSEQRFDIAQRLMYEQACWQDTAYLSQAFIPLVTGYSRNKSASAEKQDWVEKFLSHCHLPKDTFLLTDDDQYGSLACVLVDDDIGPEADIVRLVLEALPVAYTDVLQGRCRDYHRILDIYDYFGSYYFLGHFTLADILETRSYKGCYSDFDLSQAAPFDLRHSIVKVLALRRSNGLMFRLVNLADSSIILKFSRRPACYVGLCGLGTLYSGSYRSVEVQFRTALDEIWERSATLTSFADAMYHMGKTPRIVRKFYEEEAQRRKQRDPTYSEGWEEWFWGH